MSENRTNLTILELACRILAAAFLWLPATSMAAAEAEIIFLTGKGDRKNSEAENWIAAAVKDQVKPNGFVRTLPNSQMGLLLADRTQMRLNQNSQLQIKSVADAAEFTRTIVRLNAGRAWSQARPQTAPAAGAPAAVTDKSARITMETPAATLSIRGTDWEVEVRPDGSTHVIVLSGTVEVANEHGAVEVGKGEAAIAEPGKSPAKLLLVNPAERVQWVSSWKPQPRRWAEADPRPYETAIKLIESGDLDAAAQSLAARTTDPVAAALAADIRISQGDIAGAIKLLVPHARDGAGHAAATSLLARALAREDRLAEGRRLLEAAISRSPDEQELLLAAGELALLDGDEKYARQAFGKVLERRPNQAEAWFGIGLIESERENIRLAKTALEKSLESDPRMSRAIAERASVEAFAGNLSESRRILDSLLEAEPDNYPALTALGITQLKSGDAKGALESFLKAGAIEPRYARAWLYSGVAFYQLGERSRAIEAFRKTSELDTKDPLPHLLESLVLADALESGASIEAARRAQQLMPYLRSLNQIVNDQKGSANLGSALANFGMQEWASFYSYQSYSPFWAGSHFFQADRYTGSFTKNSALFKGFLTDPAAFGASNRNSTLITTPGHYGKTDLIFERAEWKQGVLIGTINGLSVDPVPIAYFASGDLSSTRSRDDATTGQGRNVTLGFGVKPQYDFGIFAFATDSDITADVRTPSLTDNPLKVRNSRADLGANLKLSAQNQLWFKVGSGRQTSDMSGSFLSQDTADALNNAFRTGIFTSNGRLERFHAEAEYTDLQFRQSMGSNDRLLTWGIEFASLDRPGELVANFVPAGLSFGETQSLRSIDLYVSARGKGFGAFGLQADLWAQSAKIRRTGLSTLGILTPPGTNFVLQNDVNERRYSEFNPRLGMTWNLQRNASLRVVAQRWRRPASVGTLGENETEGIPVNDRLPTPGGLYQRGRVQFDQESSGRYFIQAFVDRERIDNGIAGIRSIVPNLQLTQLEALRNRRDVFTAVSDIEDTPQFDAGRVTTIGLAANVLVGSRQSLALRYLRRDNRQTGANAGLAIPFLPRDMLRMASIWTLPDRWVAGVSATYRGKRFRDDLNLEEIRNGWAFGMTAYWEGTDKRSSVQVILDNLLSDKSSGLDDKSHLRLRYTYKF